MNMLEEIISKYAPFHDATIFEVCSTKGYNSPCRYAYVSLYCQNIKNDEEYELIKLFFINVIDFIFMEVHYSNSRAVSQIFIQKYEDSILFDFFPLLGDRKEDGTFELLEDKESSLRIRCKEVRYEVLPAPIFTKPDDLQ